VACTHAINVNHRAPTVSFGTAKRTKDEAIVSWPVNGYCSDNSWPILSDNFAIAATCNDDGWQSIEPSGPADTSVP
jgi:hypothetical protein